jgi:hypothetical protein
LSLQLLPLLVFISLDVGSEGDVMNQLATYEQLDGTQPITDQMEYYAGLQAEINSGTIWLMQGSAGRAAMDAIKGGYCMVGKAARKDYWGNTVPAREMLEAGSFGTYDFVAEHQGPEWADRMQEVA